MGRLGPDSRLAVAGTHIACRLRRSSRKQSRPIRRYECPDGGATSNVRVGGNPHLDHDQVRADSSSGCLRPPNEPSVSTHDLERSSRRIVERLQTQDGRVLLGLATSVLVRLRQGQQRAVVEGVDLQRDLAGPDRPGVVTRLQRPRRDKMRHLGDRSLIQQFFAERQPSVAELPKAAQRGARNQVERSHQVGQPLRPARFTSRA